MPNQVSPIPRTMILALCGSLLAIFFGFTLGGVFGAAEDSLKGYLTEQGNAVLATAYQGDTAKMQAVVTKSFTYFKRAHMHAGAIGTASLATILMLILLCRRDRLASAAAALFAFGSLLYPIFWLIAGAIAPGLGSTDAAKDALEFLAIPGAGSCLLGVMLAIACLVRDRLVSSQPA